MRFLSKVPHCCLPILVALLITGCGPSAKDRLVGKWQGGVDFDDAAVEQRLEAEGSNPIKKAIVQKILDGLESGTILLELKSDDSYTSSSQLGPLNKNDYGTWQVVSETANGATIALTSHDGQMTNVEVVFSDEDVVTAPLTGNAHGLGAFRCTRQP